MKTGFGVPAPALFLVLCSWPAPAQPAARQEIFDVHLHAHRAETFLKAVTASFAPLRRTAVTNITDPEILLQKTVDSMDRNNVQRGLLSGDNDVVQSWARAFPDRLLPSFTPDLAAKDHAAAARQFDKEAEQGKWKALGEVGLAFAGLSLNDPSLFPYYEVCERRGLPVFFHAGLSGPDPQRTLSARFLVEFGNPLLLQDIVIRFPKLRIVITHMGWPYADQALYMLYAYPNVYLDTGLVNWTLAPGLFRRILSEAVETAGSQRILFGSDQMAWPEMITSAAQAITGADYLSEADKRRILWDNAVDLLRGKP